MIGRFFNLVAVLRSFSKRVDVSTVARRLWLVKFDASK